MAFTQYKGYDVLEVVPNTRQDPERGFKRSLAHLDPLIGALTVNARSYAPVGAHTFPWFMASRAEIDIYKSFLANRAGRAVPFWVPSWRVDLPLNADIGANDPSISIVASDYTKYLFNDTNARRHLAFMLNIGQSFVYRKVTATQDNGNGTETLTLETSLGVSAPTASTFISFLYFVRLDVDNPETVWHNLTVAEAALPIIELPPETP